VAARRQKLILTVSESSNAIGYW